MINEKRVKHMVKLALYETKDGAEELKTSAYFKRDYISFNTIWSVIWMTLGYLILVLLWGLTHIEFILENMTIDAALIIVGIVLVIYTVLVAVFISVSRSFYKKKHARAYFNVRRFRKQLEDLEELYAKEDING